MVEAANLVSRHLQEPVFIYCEDFELPHIGPRYLFSHRYGSCVDAADIVTYAFRAVGIPCMEDTDARGDMCGMLFVTRQGAMYLFGI